MQKRVQKSEFLETHSTTDKRKTDSEFKESVSDVLLLKESLARQDKRLVELQHQLSEVLSLKGRIEAERLELTPGKLQSLERRVEEVVRVCEERNMEVSRKTGHTLREFAGDVAQSKESEKEIRAMVVRGTPEVKQVGTFGYDKSMPLNGIIAHLTRECRGKVCDKGIV